MSNAKVSEGEGIGFAIPINDIKTVIEDLVNNGYVTGRPVLGIGVVTVEKFAGLAMDGVKRPPLSTPKPEKGA